MYIDCHGGLRDFYVKWSESFFKLSKKCVSLVIRVTELNRKNMTLFMPPIQRKKKVDEKYK